jgi:hypothetical protein
MLFSILRLHSLGHRILHPIIAFISHSYSINNLHIILIIGDYGPKILKLIYFVFMFSIIICFFLVLLLLTSIYLVFSWSVVNPICCTAFLSFVYAYLTVISYLSILTSAYAKICRDLCSIVPLISILVSLITFSRARWNKIYDKASPCLSPFLVSKDSVIPLFHLIVFKSKLR